MKNYLHPAGRYIICDLMANGKLVTLVDVYASNEDDPDFFKTVSEYIEDFQKDEVVIGGDFNLVLNVEKDKKDGLPRTHKNVRKTVCEIAEQFDFVDAWRLLNLDTSRYTWRRKQPEVHCRLDFFLVSQSFMGNVVSADIVPGFKTDHSLITLNISLHTNPRGRGFWKLNGSLLSNTDYIDMIKQAIEQTKEKYTDDNLVNPSLLWEMIKMKVRKKSVSYAIGKKRKEIDKEHILEKSAPFEKELGLPSITTQYKNILIEKLEMYRKELEEFVCWRTQGAILR